MSRNFTIAFLVIATVLLKAQEYRASLLGVVADSSGAAIVDASIRVTNMETGVVASSKTNHDGSYLVPFLVPGRYTLDVEQAGFKAFQRSPIELRVNDRSRVDVVLEDVLQMAFSRHLAPEGNR